ncbi:hypothetical protein BD311DRAFT_763972 [Dichomitus squalens]|uniref:N-acetyltransferase domain-containing protein n=1 Tax=Dichomitus squalens TaxID=114155 RepID=A0A4Q9MED3_9APHY|nr:hypothetical protein BD311DRAFT_763972 [Dichomitus squalens]
MPEPGTRQPLWQTYKYRRYPAILDLVSATRRRRHHCPHPNTHPSSVLNSHLVYQHPSFKMASVRRLVDPSDEDVEAIVQILLDAFKDDVGMASISGNSARTHADVHRRTIRACIAHGEVYVGLVNERIQGVIASIAPGEDWHFYQQEDFLRSLSPYLSEWYSYHYIPTYEELYRSAFRSGERARRDAWHIKVLAVHPDAQRRGLGRLLLGSVSKQADASGKRIVTDVKSPYHVQWFRKSGFSHRGVKNFTSKDSTGFPLWCMAREPGPSV